MSPEKYGSSSALEKLVLGDDSFTRPPVVETPHLVEPKCRENKRKRAWIDDDDDGVDRTKSRADSILGTPAWAELASVDTADKRKDDSDTYVCHIDDYVVQPQHLQPELVSIQTCRNLNFDCVHKRKPIQCVEFHPKARVALVATLGKSPVSLVQVDGKVNAKIQSVRFQGYGVDCARFTADGEQLVVGSRFHQRFYYFDMIAAKVVTVPPNKALLQGSMGYFVMSPGEGKFMAVPGPGGTINLLCSKSKEWLCDFKMNGKVAALAFDRHGTHLYSHGDEGEVYVWDARSRRCVHKFRDDGCIKGTAIALSPNEQYLACGSNSGVVNIYDTEKMMASACPTPMKTVFNLTTSISQMKFNSASEMLVISSRSKRDAIRLVHLPSFKTFSNFPKSDMRLGKPTCFDISVNSGYMAVGNDVDSAHLFRLSHYGNY